MDICEEIVKWNKDRNIPRLFNEDKEANMLAEEFNEYIFGINSEEQVDGLCDLIVVATGTIWKLGYNPSKAMHEVLKEINSRGGSYNTETGKWEKVITGKEYKADLSKCKEDLSG